jgi:oxygen-independent coproporphyrinogen-3 oxidase
MYYFEAMQIFSHIFGMPEVFCGVDDNGEGKALIKVRSEEKSLEDRCEIYEITEDKATSDVKAEDRLFCRGLLEITPENILKRYLYKVLCGIYGYRSPWGCMTGVRPTKIVNKLYAMGFDRAQVKDHFKGFYMMSEEKAELALETTEVQSPFIEAQKKEPRKAGFYVGIPFCPTRCTYCSFAASPIGQYKKRVDEYLDVLEREINDTVALIQGKYIIESVYIGGGTPTSLNAKQLERLFKMIQPILQGGTVTEFALEAGRPDSIDREKLRLAKEAGVGRISVNPQTMNGKTLERIGRKHTPEDTITAFQLAREAGFENINMDLIAGLPGETAEDVERTLEIIEKLAPDSLTVHTLSIKRASELRYDDNEKATLKADVTGIMTEKARALAEKLGMRPFYMYRQKNQLGNHENVCYCRPGCESPYNIHIMEEDQTIIACGCGAVSKFVSEEGNIVRSFNMKGVPEYLERYDVMMQRKKESVNGT